MVFLEGGDLTYSALMSTGVYIPPEEPSKEEFLTGLTPDAVNFFVNQSAHFDRVEDRLRGMERQASFIGNKMAANPSAIYKVDTPEALLTTAAAMEHWMMTSPLLKQSWLDEEYYKDEYVPLDGDSIGEDSYYYRRVYDGVLDTSGEEDVCVDYIESSRGSVNELTTDQQATIVMSHQWVERMYLEEASSIEIDDDEVEYL